MKKLLVIVVISLAFSVSARNDSAITKKIIHTASLGFNFGATSPVPLPATVRKINAWSPGLNLSCDYEGLYLLNKVWGIALGVALDYKGMTVKNKVLYMRTKITVQDGSSSGGFEGYFSGNNETHIKNAYITIPISAVYKVNPRWSFKLGGYLAFMFQSKFSGRVYDGYIRNGSPLGEKITINEASFDLSSDQNKTDYGLLLGAQRFIYKRFSLNANFTWGLHPILKSSSRTMDFKMYNIFLTLGISYRI